MGTSNRSMRCLLRLLELAASFLGLLQHQLYAQTDVRPAVPATAAAPNSYEQGDIYLPTSRVYVFVGKTGLGHEHGIVGQLKQGRIRLDVPANSGELVFDLASFTADTDEARKFVGLQGSTDAATQQQVNANMKGPQVLDVARFATASFKVKSIKPLPRPSSRGLPQYELTGDFSLHGVSRPVQVIADLEEQNGWLHLRGGFSMLQSQFGITPFAKAFGAVGVADQLNVWGDLWISKQRQVADRPTTTR
jgi:polyisoprenoid-binding protein YceI